MTTCDITKLLSVANYRTSEYEMILYTVQKANFSWNSDAIYRKIAK